MTVTTLNRVISWLITIGVAGLFAPMLHRPTDWVASVLSALPAASIILLSVSFGCHTRQVPLRVPATAGR